MQREVLREVAAISRIIAAMREREFSKYGLKRGQHTFLTRIVENPGISQKELTELLKVDKGTTAKAIKKIIEAGYAYKERSLESHKVFQIFPTKEGVEFYPVLVKEIRRTGALALEGVNIELVYRELIKMRKNLEAELIQEI